VQGAVEAELERQQPPAGRKSECVDGAALMTAVWTGGGERATAQETEVLADTDAESFQSFACMTNAPDASRLAGSAPSSGHFSALFRSFPLFSALFRSFPLFSPLFPSLFFGRPELLGSAPDPLPSSRTSFTAHEPIPCLQPTNSHTNATCAAQYPRIYLAGGRPSVLQPRDATSTHSDRAPTSPHRRRQFQARFRPCAQGAQLRPSHALRLVLTSSFSYWATKSGSTT
jgi:hypothetical protein